jgi:hypothetical protein
MTYSKPYFWIISSRDFIRTLVWWEKSLKNVWSSSTNVFDVIWVLFQITVYGVLYIKLSSIFKFILETCKYPQKIGRVNFLMKILATMAQLCTERPPESKNPPVKSEHFCSLVIFKYIIDP